MTTTDVHDLGSFASLKEVWEKYPNGAQTGDYVFIDGVRYNWNKYEYQWFTPIATIDKNIEVFDISTYNFSTNDWRTDLADGEYTVIYDTAAVGRLLKYKDSFFVEGELAVVESKDGSTYTEVVEAETKKSYSKVIYSNLYHKVVYDSSTLIYKVSIAEESLRLTSAEKKIESMQKVDSNLLNSVASLGSRAASLETWQGKIKGKNVLTDLSVNENTEDTLTFTTTSTSLSSGTDTDNEIELPTATTEKAGIMTATDKENVDKVPTLETTAAAHTTKIASLEAKDKTLKDDIDNLAGVVGTHYDETVNNTKNIEANAQKIADNVTAISKANDNITANTKSIEDLQKADKELAENISLVNTELQSAEADIAKHSTRLDTAEAAIKADEEKLESTINDVATNAKGIADNKTAIGTNATNIATNTANIATNTEAIKDLQEADQELAEGIVDHEIRIAALEEKKTYSPIQVKIIGGKPKLINYDDYVKDGMVLLLYRSCRKQNRNRFAEERGDPRNPVKKGWNMMGRDNSVRLLKASSVLGFNNREHHRWHENNVTDANFECDASLLVEPHEDRDGNSIVSWGKRQVSLDDAKGKPRMLRFRFAVGYAKPFDTKTKTSDVYQLVSNLAEFSVVYSMSADGYYWKFSR